MCHRRVGPIRAFFLFMETPNLQKYMTPQPHTIGKNMPIKKAMEMMRDYRIRHLPVEEAGKLVGILSDRDVKLVNGIEGHETMTVEEAMTPDPYTAKPDAALDQVVTVMADHKYGCTIVTGGHGEVVGIFTANDALRVLAETLKTHYHH